MPPGDDDEVTIKGLFEDAISPELEDVAHAAKGAARALSETGAGGEAAAVGMDRATIAGGRLERQLKDVERASEAQRLAQLRLTAAEQEAQKIRAKGVLTASDMARVESLLSHAHNDATKAANGLRDAHVMLDQATDRLGMRLLRTAGSVGFLTKAFSGLKFIATTNVFGSLIGGVSSLGAAGVAAVAGLAPLLGTAGAIPALGLAAVTAFGGMALLTGGIMGAVKAMTTAGPASTQAQAAINRLDSSSANLAYRVYGISTSLKDMRAEAVRSAMPELTGTLNNVQRLLPVVRHGFIGVTGAMSSTLEEATSRMVSARGDLDLIASRNTILVRTIGHAVVDGLDAGRHMMVAAGPMVQNFADRFRGEMRRVNSDLAANPERTEAFFNRVFDRAMSFIHVLSDLGHGIVNIFHGAQPLTDHMGAGIEAMAAHFREWSGSGSGQVAIKQWFTDAIPVVDQIGHLIGNIGTALGDLSTSGGTASMIHDLATIVPLLSKMLTLIQNVSSTIPGGNSALAMLFLMNRVGMSPRMLGGGMSGMIRGGMLFSRGARGIEGVEGGFAGRTSQSMMGRLGARMAGRAVGGAAAMGGADVGALALGGGAAAAEGGAAAGGAGLMGLLAAVPVVGWIAAAVVAIGAGAVLLYQHWKPFRDAVQETGRFFEHIGKVIGGAIMTGVHALAHAGEAVGRFFERAYHFVTGIGDKLGHMESSVWHGLTGWIPGLYTGGPVAAGRPYLVGERGPELFATAGSMRVVGGDGAELLASKTPGFVLPNEALKAIQSIDVRQAAARSFPHASAPVPQLVGVGTGTIGRDVAVSLEGLPPIVIGPNNTFTTAFDVEAAVKAGIQSWIDEMRDRS